MLKNIIKYIFIYTIGILLVGCDNPTSVESCDYCHLDIETNLPMDENGIYHLNFNNGEIQTFTQLRAYVGYEMEYVGWTTNTTFEGCTWDYCEDIPTNLKSLTFPSIHSNNTNILKKYRTVVKELAQKTNCNNQIIDIEFFILSEDDIRVIEINPRCGGNYLPIYNVTGYMPLYVSEQLKNNIIPSKTEKMGKAYVRYNYEFSSKNSVQKGVYSNNILTIRAFFRV